MNSPIRLRITSVAYCLLVGLLAGGCSNETPPTPPTIAPAAPVATNTEAAPSKRVLDLADQAIVDEQETCPVCGNSLADAARPVKLTIGDRIVFVDGQDCWAPMMSNPDKYLAALESSTTPDDSQDGAFGTQMLCLPMPFRSEDAYKPMPIVACFRTETMSATVEEVLDSTEFSDPVQVFAKLVDALKREDEERIAELLAPYNGLGFKDPAAGVKLMLGTLDGVVIERCYYAGSLAYVSARGDVNRPANAVIPIDLTTQMAAVGATANEATQLIATAEFALKAAPDYFKPMPRADYPNSKLLGHAFGKDETSGVPIYITQAVDLLDGKAPGDGSPISKAVADFERAYSALVSEDYDAFAACLDGNVARYFERQRSSDAKLQGLVRMIAGKRQIKTAGVLGDIVAIISEGDTAATKGPNLDLMIASGDGHYLLGTLRPIETPASRVLKTVLQPAPEQ